MNARGRTFPIRAALGLGVALVLAGAVRAEEEGAFAAAWAVPEEGCKPVGGLRASQDPGDASLVFLFEPGATVDAQHLGTIRRLLPEALWTQRERFFHAGMRLEIGPCFRDYAPPDFFSAATARFRGQASLDEQGGLVGHTAGLPFAPDTIDPKDALAGQRWAWNVESRYQGAGLRGRFRVTELAGRTPRDEPLEGEIFAIELQRRADRADARYRVPFAKGKLWVAGGILRAPASARDYAWRQFRDAESRIDPARLDDLHAYLPAWRRVRRLPALDVEGLWVPSPRAGEPSTTARSGFEALVLRPLLWTFRVAGVQDLLAPINLAAPLWPEDGERDFGAFGLSFASDRWELRRVLVLEGRVRSGPRERGETRELLYVDLQTLAPLYFVSYDAQDREVDVGVLAGRWSEDRSDHPRWPDDRQRPVRAIGPAGAAFANVATGAGWRRESWELVATPPPDEELARWNGVAGLSSD